MGSDDSAGSVWRRFAVGGAPKSAGGARGKKRSSASVRLALLVADLGRSLLFFPPLLLGRGVGTGHGTKGAPGQFLLSLPSFFSSPLRDTPMLGARLLAWIKLGRLRDDDYMYFPPFFLVRSAKRPWPGAPPRQHGRRRTKKRERREKERQRTKRITRRAVAAERWGRVRPTRERARRCACARCRARGADRCRR